MTVRDSRAGDDFHYLWAARRCLPLVDPRSDLRLVRLEGPTPADAPEEDDSFLGVDLIEYFGGDTALSAHRVVVSQLKYSTRHPTTEWTVARLRRAGRKVTSTRAEPSVVRRLADAWKGLVRLRSTGVSIGLVSNQPASPRITEILAAVEAGVRAGETTAQLLKRLPQFNEDLVALKESTGLGSRDFVAFLSSLDLSECGTEPRVFQRLRLRTDVGNLSATSPTDLANDLVELVRLTVLPEAQRLDGLRREDILAQLGATQRDLFPAPCSFDAVPPSAVHTSDASALADVICVDGARHVLAHGTFGVGKTTTLQQLEPHLPDGSIVIPYDCFGRGDYRIPTSGRHLVSTALVQIANEVALRCALPPLIPSDVSAEVVWRRFVALLERAGESLRPSAVLVVAIDAADNALFAGSIANDRTFVPGLWAQTLPANVRVLATCRTAFRTDVLPGATAGERSRPLIEYELRGFDEAGSTDMLRRFVPGASEAEGAEFHRLTSGNPRLQAYALEADGASSVQDVLRNAGEGLNAIFEGIVDDAFDRLDLAPATTDGLAVMHAMSPPARLSTLGEVLGLTPSGARDLCERLAPGVLIDGDSYGFRDQSFDDYVRDRIGDDRRVEANRRLAQFFSGRPEDPYAAASLAGHLYNGGDLEGVVKLALNRGTDLTADPLWKADIVRRRLHFATRAAAEAGEIGPLAELLIAAAHSSRSDATLLEAVRNWPEMAEQFVDPDLLAVLHDREENDSWRGPTLMRTAALLAWHAGHEDEARARLAMAEAWIRRWSRLPDDDRSEWDIGSDDVAAAAEARFKLEGSQRAAREVRRWRPAEFRLEVSQDLVRRLSVRLAPDEMRAAMVETRTSHLLQAEAIAHYTDAHVAVAKSWVVACAAALLRVPVSSEAFKTRPPWGPSFCLAAAQAGSSQRVVRELVSRIGAPMGRYAPGKYDDLSRLSAPLLCVALEHLGKRSKVDVEALVAGLLPLPGPSDDDYENIRARVLRDRREYCDAVDLLLPVIRARVSLARGTADWSVLEAVVVAPLARFATDGSRWWFSGQGRFATWLKAVAVAAVAAGDLGRAAFQSCLDVVDTVAGAGAAQLRLAVGAQIVCGGAHADLGELLVEQGASGVVNGSGTATERRDSLLRAANAVLRVEPALAEQCFRQALEVARDIDDDTIPEIALAARLGASALSQPAANRRRLAQRLAMSIDGAVGHVSDDEYLPVRRVLDSTARLDPGTALMAASRWHHVGVVEIEHAAATIAKAILESDQVDPLDVLAIANLSTNASDRLDVMLAACSKLGADPSRAGDLAEVLAEVEMFVGRDLDARVRSAAAGRVVDWCRSSSRGHRHPFEYVAAIAELGRAETSQSSHLPTADVPEVSAGGAMDLFDDAAVGDVLSGDAHRYATTDELVQVFARSVSATRIRDRVAALDRLRSLMSGARRSVVRAIYQVIQDRTSAWSSTPGVEAWTQEFLQYLPQHHITDLFTVIDDPLDRIRTDLPFSRSSAAIAAVCLAAAEHLSEFSDAELHAIAEFLLKDAPDETRFELAESILAELDGDPVVSAEADTICRSLVGFHWDLLRANDVRTRRRAATSTRYLLTRSPHPDLAAEWGSVLKHPLPPAAGAMPMVMSALTWAWMITARSVDECPARFESLYDQAESAAIDRAFPHAAIREFARRTAERLRVAVDPPGALPADDLDQANRPAACASERKGQYSADDAFTAAKGATFDFDTMDTVRYWFHPLARVFGLDTAEIVARADRWVTGVWGATNEQCVADHGVLAQRYSSDLISNDHGRSPTVESLQTYLENHAMLVVAGELLDEGYPVVCEPYEDAGDPWEGWLRSSLDSSPDWWHADRRGPVPLDPASYGRTPADEIWATLESMAEPSSVPGVPEGWLWAKGHSEWADGQVRVSAWMYSALVTPESAPALIRSIESSSSPATHLPSAGDDDSRDGEIHEPGFVLRGWVEDFHDYEGGLDVDDSVRSRFALGRLGPCVEFQAEQGLTANRLATRFVDQSGELIAAHQIWCYGDGTDDGDISSGGRLVVNLDHLRAFAAGRGLDVVVGLMADRFREGRSHEGVEDDDKFSRIHRAWLVRSGE